MAYRVAGGLMTAFFLFAVAVQWNDPDPAIWMAVYGAAAILSGWAVWRRPPWILPALLCVGTLLWAATIAPRVIGKTTLRDTFATMGMKSDIEEEAREMMGLGIVAAWMGVILVAEARARRHVRSA